MSCVGWFDYIKIVLLLYCFVLYCIGPGALSPQGDWSILSGENATGENLILYSLYILNLS